MLTDLLKELNNWFDRERLYRRFTVSNGSLLIPEAQDGQYIRICESVFNDGVYQYPVTNLKDETFDGAVWLLAVPDEVIRLSDDIDSWIKEYADDMRTPYQSESFGGYSYTKTSTQNDDGTGVTWSDIFADRLKRWRKI